MNSEHPPILVRPSDTSGSHALEVRIREDAEAVILTLCTMAKFANKGELGVLRPPNDEGG